MSTRSRPIRRLSPLVVNQIAAGEVIERPASVVKELMENALDAGTTRIDVAIEKGGKELIRVTDDGGGIAFDELELALDAHATSKIESAEELDMIATMGFRGEALASIAAVSRLVLTSRQRENPAAGVISGAGDEREPPRPAAGPPGTTVTVRNLFFNTPARRKFFKTDQTETGRVVDVVVSLALANPSIGVTLTVDDRKRLDFPPDQPAARRVLEVLGPELEGELLELDHVPGPDSGDVGIRGLIGTPAIARGSARHQRVYLNGRPISDRTIIHALKEAYRGLIEPNRHPTLVLFLRIDPAAVDVNVHPAKAEVRFRNQSQVHRTVLAAVRDRLRAADLTPPLDLERSWNPSPEFGRGVLAPMAAGESAGSTPGGTSPEGDARGGDRGAGAFVDSFRRLAPREKGFVYQEMKAALAADDPEILEREIVAGPARAAAEVLQIHDSFIVTEDADGLLIVDQHALHERVMFERLRQRVDVDGLESQRMLMPLPIEVDHQQLESLEALRPLLERLGIEVEAIGPGAVAIHAFTSLLFERKVDPVEFMRELLSNPPLRGQSTDSEAALHMVLDMMACKAAIKAGDRLEPGEMAALLEAREAIERSSNCPHGRPTSLRLSLRELERQFGRR